MKKGIDVSKWQGVINFDEVKNAGVEFVILRAGYGKNLTAQDDANFKHYYEECKRVGLPVGLYLYSYAKNVEDAKSEAEHVLRLIKDKSFEIPCFYDLEDKSIAGLSNEALLANVKAFCGAVSAVMPCGVYASKSWFDSKFRDSFYNSVPRWVAHYTDKVESYEGFADIWQYSSAGSVTGINGKVDMNYMYTDYINVKPEAPAEEQQTTPVAHAHGVGENVVFSTCYKSSTAPINEAIPADQMKVNHGVITKIVDGAPNPYLLDNGLCWVNDGDIRGAYTGEPKPAAKPAEKKAYKAGDAVVLKDKPLYDTASTDKARKDVSGIYYIYDGKANHGRYRITNDAKKVNKKPISANVTGWVSL